jgi:hypothetical protein
MRYKVDDEEKIWEDTGHIKVYNYPASNNTYSYITRIYREICKDDMCWWREIQGNPVYFHELTNDKERILSMNVR